MLLFVCCATYDMLVVRVRLWEVAMARNDASGFCFNMGRCPVLCRQSLSLLYVPGPMRSFGLWVTKLRPSAVTAWNWYEQYFVSKATRLMGRRCWCWWWPHTFARPELMNDVVPRACFFLTALSKAVGNCGGLVVCV